MSRKWHLSRLKKIILVAATVSAATVGALNLALPNYFQQKYFHEAYMPRSFENEAIGGFPSEYKIGEIPWISYEKAYCESAALQMVAYKHGMKPSISYINFLMGFTYGAFHPGDPIQFLPYNDPITGSRLAAPYLGLRMEHLTTNDPDAFLRAIRFYLSKDYPVDIQLNAAMIWEQQGIMPHSELIVGYDAAGFYFFETTMKHHYIEEAKGLRITDRLLIEAVSNLNETYGRPWRFALSIFEKDNQIEDLSQVMIRNGETLVGSKQGPIAWGATAIREFVSRIRENGDLENIGPLEAMSYTRLDNALFLEQFFAYDTEIGQAAELLRKADACYKQALEMAIDNTKRREYIDELANLLVTGANYEEEAGIVLMSRGRALLID